MPSCRVPLLSFLTCFAAFAIDQSTKQIYFDEQPETSSSFSFFHGLVTQVWHRNHGITFNIPIPNALILLLTLLAVLVVLYGISKAIRRSSLLEGLTLGLLLGGALGNFIDRWQFAFVRDWILAFHRSAFNLADVAIFTGLLGYLLLQNRHLLHEKKSI